MRRPRININGIEVNISSIDTLPILFNKRIDKWESYIGSYGTSADNTTPNLTIPYTKNNAQISGDSAITTLDNKIERRPLSIKIDLDGTTFFAGTALLKQTVIGTDGENLLQYELKGDNLDLFSQLDGVSLRDLDLGTQLTDTTDITDSWVDITDTTNTCVFAPVAYGGITTDIVELEVSLFRYQDGLRPSVRIWKIVEAIFSKLLGYTIDSFLYETQQFKNLLYAFGVGDDWKRNDNYSIYACYIGKNANQNNAPNLTYIDFDNESGQFSDPQNLNINTFAITYFQAATPNADGWFQFSFKVNANCDTVELWGVNKFGATLSSPFLIQGGFKPNVRNITDPILFCPDRGLSRLYFRVRKASGVTNISASGSYYQAQLLDRFAYGAPLEISSCLHDRPVKDFLRGIQHLYNLVFYSDSVGKIVWFEPRFATPPTDYTRIPEALYKPEEAYYQAQASAQDIEIDAQKWYVENRRTFGDWLKLGYTEDSQDGLLNFYNSQIKPNGSQSLWGAKFNFNSTDKNGQTNLNPFFTTLPNLQISNTSSGGINNFYAIYPCIVEDIYDLIRDYDKIPTYESAPKIAQYFGVLDLSAYLNGDGSPQYPLLYYTGYTGAGQPLPEITSLIPSMFQVFPDWEDYWDVLGGVPFNLSYGDLQYNNLSSYVPPKPVAGLITFYIEKYLRIINEDKWLIGQFILRLSQFYTLDFRTPFAVKTSYGKGRYWGVQIQRFAPLDSDKTQMVIVLDSSTFEGEHEDLESNEDVYMFVLDQNILVNK